MKPQNLRFTSDHEWIGQDGDAFRVGITDYAQEQLGDITYVELPKPPRTVAKHDVVATVESVKAAGDVYSPVAGEVVAVNHELVDHPERVNQDPYGAGWFFKIIPADPNALNELMDWTQYSAYVKSLETHP